ncbi:MAG: protein phosphatase 2C domain-containing protein [Verrucomicrobia bacterium]|nr:protein phosphatase 2C domain-containing protein [Verrucomicrobiota bacterium]MDA1067166.1 protein phosphatase 2C domain-containing protein [Verrucomicrobiota bacterium]
MNFTAAGNTHVGLVRKKNEDSFFCDNENKVYAVADGLGGLPFGDLASKAAIQYLELWTNARRSENWKGIDWEMFMKEVNHQVIQTGQLSAHGLGIGTTFSLGMIRNNYLEISHIGDSRIYLFRDGSMEQITTDHTLETFAKEQNQFQNDSDIPDHYKHTLTQCLGQRQLIKPEHTKHELQSGDRLLFCSDGISGPVPVEELQRIMTVRSSAEATIEQLIQATLDNGAPDNVTGVVIFAE